MRDPLVFPVLAFAGGIVLNLTAGIALIESCTAAVAFAALAVAARYARDQSPLTGVLVCLAMLAAGCAWSAFRSPGPDPVIDFSEGEELVLAGCVADLPQIRAGRHQFVLELEPGARVRVTLLEPRPNLGYGQRLELHAALRHPSSFHNPGAFDYRAYLARRAIFWTATARIGAPVNQLPGDCGNPVLRAIYGWKSAALARIDRFFPTDTYRAGMLRALLLGDDSALQAVWIEHFRRTGTYHALVISGAHVSVLVLVLLFLLRITPLSMLACTAVSACVAWLYALAAGGESPVTRSALGLTLVLATRFFFRRARILNILALTAFVFLVFDPRQILEPSFQLTFSSVAAIGAFVIPLCEASTGHVLLAARSLSWNVPGASLHRIAAAWRVEMQMLAATAQALFRVPAGVALRGVAFCARAAVLMADTVLTTATIQLALALPMIVYFHRVSLSGLSANVFVSLPLTAAVPFGFLALLTGWPPLAWAAGTLLDWSRGAAAWHAGWEPNWRTPDPPLWLASLFLAFLLASALGLRRGAKWTLIPACAGVAVSLALVIHPFPPALVPGHLELSAIDVGQGESLFLATPAGRTLLLDAGGFPSWRPGAAAQLRFDHGEDVVSPYLWTRGLRRLDAVALSHAHDDHAQGLLAVIENFRPREIWVSRATSGPVWDRVERHARLYQTQIRRLQAGDQFQFGGAALAVLSPPPDYQPAETAHNNDSLVIQLSYGQRTFLLTGDIENQMEQRMIAHMGPLRADVLKVAHHGSRTSTSGELLDMLRPSFAVISAGLHNRYGLPHATVVDRLASRRIQTLRTDTDGLVTVRTDGYRIRTESNRAVQSKPALWDVP